MLFIYPDDGGNRLLHNVCIYLPNYKTPCWIWCSYSGGYEELWFLGYNVMQSGEINRHCRGRYRLLLQVGTINQVIHQREVISFCFLLLPFGCCIPEDSSLKEEYDFVCTCLAYASTLKMSSDRFLWNICGLPPTETYSVTTQKTVIFVFIAVRASYLTYRVLLFVRNFRIRIICHWT